jgi:hypothetical protein
VIFTVTPVSWFVTVTLALGISAPVGSKTWPRSVPVVVCAGVETENANATVAANNFMDKSFGTQDQHRDLRILIVFQQIIWFPFS